MGSYASAGRCGKAEGTSPATGTARLTLAKYEVVMRHPPAPCASSTYRARRPLGNERISRSDQWYAEASR